MPFTSDTTLCCLPSFPGAKETKNEQAASVEARVPYWKHKLVEQFLRPRFHRNLKSKDCSESTFLRRFAPILAFREAINRRKKQGFSHALGSALAGKGPRPFLHDTLPSSACFAGGEGYSIQCGI